MKNKEIQIAIIGLGKFGGSLCKEFASLGSPVLAIDRSSDRIKEYTSIATHAIQANANEDGVLRELGVRNFDLIVVSLGDDMQASILTTLALKELGNAKIWAKAQSKYHGKILHKIGADRVIYPEQDIAKRLAYQVISDNILDYIELSNEHSILEMTATKKIDNKSIQELDVRARFGCTIVGIRKGERFIISPSADERIYKGDLLIIIGSNQELKKFEKKAL